MPLRLQPQQLPLTQSKVRQLAPQVVFKAAVASHLLIL